MRVNKSFGIKNTKFYHNPSVDDLKMDLKARGAKSVHLLLASVK